MEKRIGPHTLRIAGDTAFLALVGDVQAVDVLPILSHIERINGGTGSFYVVADLSGVTSIAPEARRVASKWPAIGRAGGTAVIGASLLTQTLVTLVSRANSLLSGVKKRAGVAFFKSEGEAVAWLSSLREPQAGSG